MLMLACAPEGNAASRRICLPQGELQTGNENCEHKRWFYKNEPGASNFRFYFTPELRASPARSSLP